MTETKKNESEKPVAVQPRIIPGNAQHKGERNEQQDSFGFSDFENDEFVKHAGFLAIVADGMGGMALGKESSEIAVKTFLEVYAEKEVGESIPAALDRCLHRANRSVNRKAAEAGVEGEAGTTLVAAVIHGKRLYRISAGDSRIYLFRDNKLQQLTQDYNYGRVLDRMVENGEIGRAEAASHPSRAALTSYLGKAELDEYDQPTDVPIELKPGDKVLLASDGLFGFLPEADIETLMLRYPQQAAEALIAATINSNQPYQDNVTVAILGYDLPTPVSLADTQLRKPTERLSSTSQEQKRIIDVKWVIIAFFLIILAVAGFWGGKFFYENNFVDSEPTTLSKPSGSETSRPQENKDVPANQSKEPRDKSTIPQ